MYTEPKFNSDTEKITLFSFTDILAIAASIDDRCYWVPFASFGFVFGGEANKKRGRK